MGSIPSEGLRAVSGTAGVVSTPNIAYLSWLIWCWLVHIGPDNFMRGTGPAEVWRGADAVAAPARRFFLFAARVHISLAE